MTTPVRLVERPTIADDIKSSVISILREALDEAMKGEIEAVTIIKKRPGGVWAHNQSGVTDFPDAIGRLEIVKHEWISEYLQGE